MNKTLLDEFAMAALNNSSHTIIGSDEATPARIADHCYDIAEAMMTERAKRLPAAQPTTTANISIDAQAVVDAIAAMKGQKATCSMICRKAANWDGDMTALREIGQILRERGFQKVRSGGKDYYQL